MKKTIPFDYFEEGQKIYFDIPRLEELENATGKCIGEITSSQMSMNILINALVVGLKHHNYNKKKQFYYDKIDEFITNGGIISELWETIIKALIVSGLFGVKIADAVIENKPIEEAKEKNV